MLAGLVSAVVLTTTTDAVLHATDVFPPPRQPKTDGLCALALAYRVAVGVPGGCVASRLAPAHPTALGVVAVALPSAWLGGRLHRR